MKSNHLANRVFPFVEDACIGVKVAWLEFENAPDLIKSITSRKWAAAEAVNEKSWMINWLDWHHTRRSQQHNRAIAKRVGNGFKNARARTLFRKLVRASAAVRKAEHQIIVNFGRRAHNPCLLAARYGEKATPIPWLQDQMLRLRFY